MPDRVIACTACGRAFGCDSVSGGCWCNAVDVPPEVLARLREEHADCLCADCLRAAARPPLPAAS
jgi:hypothetical protein